MTVYLAELWDHAPYDCLPALVMRPCPLWLSTWLSYEVPAPFPPGDGDGIVPAGPAEELHLLPLVDGQDSLPLHHEPGRSWKTNDPFFVTT